MLAFFVQLDALVVPSRRRLVVADGNKIIEMCNVCSFYNAGNKCSIKGSSEKYANLFIRGCVLNEERECQIVACTVLSSLEGAVTWCVSLVRKHMHTEF